MGDIRNDYAPPRLQHPVDLLKAPAFVRRQIQNAVGEDQVRAVVT